MKLHALTRAAIFATLSLSSALFPGTDARAEFVNFESGHVRPLALTPSGELLLAVNTPDNRVEVIRVADSGEFVRIAEIVVGLEPVAIVARGENEAYVVNHLSDSVSVIDLRDPTLPFVKETLLVGDEPRDVIIAGPNHDKVFVTTAHRGQNRPGDPQLTTPGVGRADVWVFDADDLRADAAILTLFTDTPRGLAASPDGTRVYAAGFHTGNQTTVLGFESVAQDPLVNVAIDDGFDAPGPPEPTSNHEGVEMRPQGLILKYDGEEWRDPAGRDWSPRMRFHLPDRDLFTIDASVSPPVETASSTGVGTILFNLAVHPVSGDVYVSNLESQNHVRFEPVINGHVAESRVTIVSEDLVNPVHLNPHIDYSSTSGPASELAQSLAFPLGMEFSSDGSKLYVAAFGSQKVGVLNPAGAVIERIEVGGGPSGLALDAQRERLYVFNRFDQTISIVDTEQDKEIDVFPLRYDPESLAIREGRPLLYDAANSGHGDSACASCHIFGDFDSLSWDLGDPDGDVEDNPVVRVEIQGGRPLQDFHPMKGPMTTQSLRGMQGAGPMHWRGDRNGGADDPFSEEKAFMAFRPAFQGLLGMDEELPESEMEKFRDFILTVQYPPNPIAPLDGTLTAEQDAGKAIFDSNGSRSGIGGDGDECADCHALPFGTDGRGSFELLPQDMKVAHLRNLYQKVGMFGTAVPTIEKDAIFGQGGSRLADTPTPHLGDQVRGFGFLHDGSVPTLFDFFRFPLLPIPFSPFTFLDQPGRTGVERVEELVEFMLAFDTGLAPAVGQQITLTADDLTADPSIRLDRYLLLRGRADADDVDLVVHGAVGTGDDGGRITGLLYTGLDDDNIGRFQTDRVGVTISESDIIAAMNAGVIVTVTAVPPGCGERIALDRDSDGAYDGDELAAGSDPADPDSIPGSGKRFLRGNCNGDLFLDVSDAVHLLLALFSGDGVTACTDVCDANSDGGLDISDASYLLNFLFLGGAAPGSVPECETSSAECVDEVCP